MIYGRDYCCFSAFDDVGKWRYPCLNLYIFLAFIFLFVIMLKVLIPAGLEA